MASKPLSTILETFPETHYHAQWKLLTWHPRGVFDDALADEIIGVLESEEMFHDFPFNRYADFGGLTRIQLKVGHVFQIAEHRRESLHQVKSAIFADSVVGFGIARMYESLMAGASIQVRAFKTREAAAEWLGAPPATLLPA
jgi:hypothetical protein